MCEQKENRPQAAWKLVIARRVAWWALRCLHRAEFAGIPAPEAFAVWPAVSAQDASPALCRLKQTGGKSGLMIVSRR
ncbi:hypothetical protein CRG49_008705 [Neisseria sp. N95_16]|nr:hypothetical protein CRG49_008705 [Neisseria sp. N95_16]PJO77119.1 hypothetical protein CWC45_12145 [Neisseria sp. N177_16]